MFVAAHALLYKFFCSRAIQYGIASDLWWLCCRNSADSNSGCSFRWAKQQAQLSTRRQFLVLANSPVRDCTCFIHTFEIPKQQLHRGKAPALYEFFGSNQKILIASLSSEADNLPIFSKRSILVAGMQFLSCQLWSPIRQRATDLRSVHQNLASVAISSQTYG